MTKCWMLLVVGVCSSERTCDKEFMIRRAATNRVLNVLRHWVSKHSQVESHTHTHTHTYTHTYTQIYTDKIKTNTR